MKRFIIDTRIQNYSLEINNCIDYKIAGACAIFNKIFFEYYCAYWSMLKNWSNLSNNFEIREHILAIFKIEILIISSENENIINEIIRCLDSNRPVLLIVTPNTLFFSVVYKNQESNNIKHLLLITGYDKDKDLFYIYENSINKDSFFSLFKTNPLFEYQITKNMLYEIIDMNCCMQKDFLNNSVMCLNKNGDVSDYELSNRFINDLKKFLLSDNDNLINKLKLYIQGENLNIYNKQFHRDYVNSIEAIFNVLCNCFDMDANEINGYKKLITDRNKIIAFVNKKIVKKEVLELHDITRFHSVIINDKNNLYDFLIKNKKELEQIEEFNLLYLKGTKIETDSEKKSNSDEVFSANVFLKKSLVNESKGSWTSGENTQQHWLKVSLTKEYEIVRIVLENSRYYEAIISDFMIFFSADNTNWTNIIEVKNNTDYINSFDIHNKKAKYIKIVVTKCSKSFEKKCIIRDLYIYGRKEEKNE